MREKLTASSLGVSGETLDTLAVAHMVEWRSKSVGAARISYAGIGTSQIAAFAIFGHVAVRINAALRY